MVKITVVARCSHFNCGNGKDERSEEFESIPTWRQLAENWNLSTLGFIENASGTLKLEIDKPLIQNMELYFFGAGYGLNPIYAVLII